MGAGTQTQHFIQDAAELYFPAKMQQLAVDCNVSIPATAESEQKLFVDYCGQPRNITVAFEISSYKNNVDSTAPQFLAILMNLYPNEKFQFEDVNRAGRNVGEKHDTIIKITNHDDIKLSLKNQKTGLGGTQFFACTFTSFLNHFVFSSVDGVGSHLDSSGTKSHMGKNKKTRDDTLRKSGLHNLVPMYAILDAIHKDVKDTFVGPGIDWNDALATLWKQKCLDHGWSAAKVVNEALSHVSNTTIKTVLLKKMGLATNGAILDEHLLVMGKGQFLTSIDDPVYAMLVSRLNSPDCFVEHEVRDTYKGIVVSFCDNDGVICEVTIPFTLNKNGGFAISRNPKEWARWSKKEKILIWYYGQQRPKKNKEIDTITNIFFDLSKLGVNIRGTAIKGTTKAGTTKAGTTKARTTGPSKKSLALPVYEEHKAKSRNQIIQIFVDTLGVSAGYAPTLYYACKKLTVQHNP